MFTVWERATGCSSNFKIISKIPL